MKRASAWPWVAMIVSCLGAGAMTVTSKMAVASVDPIGFSFYLFLFSLPFGLLMTTVLRVPEPSHWRPAARLLLWHCLLLAGAWTSLAAGLQRLDPTVASFLGRTESIFLIILAGVILREKLTPIHFIGLALALVGATIMRAGTGFELRTGDGGYLFVLSSAFLFAFCEILAKRTLTYVGPGFFTVVRNVLMVVVLAIVQLVLTGTPPPFPPWESVGLIMISALGGPVIARYFYMIAISHLPVSTCTIVAHSVPLFAGLTAFLLLGTYPSAIEIFGGLVLLAGCLVFVIRRERAQASASRAVSSA